MNSFEKVVTKFDTTSLTCRTLDTLQINTGFRCNHQCWHCHLRASPQRNEQMTWETMEKILGIIDNNKFSLIDITGGAPELHPRIKEFISMICKDNKSIQVRTNLTLLYENDFKHLAAFFADHDVQLAASLPCYLEENVDSQRGQGVFKKCITTLKRLNQLGYGRTKTLTLNLMHNPLGPSLPPLQSSLEETYRNELKNQYNIDFTHLFTITNMPIGRFDDHLNEIGEKTRYCSLLENSFNPSNIHNIMCRHQICVGWNGLLYDCDFNLALNKPVDKSVPQHIDCYDYDALINRPIKTSNYCFGCTAGNGSSCGGALA
jgi:radical SAM/Cys-rich protein